MIYILTHQVFERKPFCVKGAVVEQKGWATLCWVLGSMWEFQLVGILTIGINWAGTRYYRQQKHSLH